MAWVKLSHLCPFCEGGVGEGCREDYIPMYFVCLEPYARVYVFYLLPLCMLY